MSGQKGDENQLALSIDQMLQDLSPLSENPSIRRVEDLLRSTNELAYDPRIVAIGPLHRGKKNLKNMEQEKKHYLKLLLQSRSELSVDRYVQKIKDLEDRTRKCYDEPIALESGEFVEMLLLDGIFIIEFLRKYNTENDDTIFKFGHVVTQVLHDLLLLENQIPFFIIEEIFGLTKDHDQEKIGELIKPLVSPYPMPECASMQNVTADHLLAVVHRLRCHSFHVILGEHSGDMTENIKSAKELKETGIRFKECNNRHSWLDIRFKKKRIYMPVLQVSDVTESLFRNMIAYEYYLPRDNPKYVTDYMFFLHCLIHAPRDAQLLRQCGIISNWIGGDEKVYHLINQLGSNVLPSENFSYLDVFQEVNQHCERRRNRWIEILRRDYFDSPWKLISLVAGVVLLGVSIAQLVFAILSYRNDRKKGS